MPRIAAPINFSNGLNTKADPWQIPAGQFLELENTVFTKAGLLNKRNGFPELGTISGSPTYLTTFNNNLMAVGTSLQAFSQYSENSASKGSIQPVTLSTLPTGRSAVNQTQCDSVIASNGLVCTVYTEVNNGTASYKYVIADSTTGQNIVVPTVIPVSSGTVTGSPRVFLLSGYFVIVFTNVITAVSHLQYIAISASSPTTVRANADIASAYIPATTLSWDAVVVNSNLYIAYNTTSGGQAVKITYLNTAFTVATAQTFASSVATIMSLSADTTNPSNPVIYAAFWDAGGSTGNVVAVDQNLNKKMTATQWLGTGTILNVTATAQSGVVTIAYENSNNYSYDSGVASHYLSKIAVTLPATVTTGSVGSPSIFLRSVGLASKAFLYNSTMYMLGAYQSSLQNTYFLFDISGHIISRLAYENGGGYLTTGLPQAQVNGTVINISYLYKDLIQTQNTTGLAQSIGPAGTSNIYSQTGVNLAFFDFAGDTIYASEIGGNLILTGGMAWAFDGQNLSEQGFHLFPDSVECTWSATGGAIVAKPDGSTNTNAYYYQVVYEWMDAQGNINRSAPSIPVPVTTTGAGTAGSITVNVPYLRLTYKTNVQIVIYRWSVAQQNYYRITSITAPQLNSTSSDSLAFVDTLADSSILGNTLIYTTGGVLENTPGPAAIDTDLFDDRYWFISSEDQNLLGYSKQVIEGTPVEVSDLLTIFVAPSTGVQGSTGTLKCLFPMDEKQVLFKENAIYYINGVGPDNTGNNSQYSQPIFVTSSVGCSNKKSIVLTPLGLMFQSNKGIWLLDRSLQTSYIGAPVEAYNGYTVTSAVNVPETTQVRFTLSNGMMLMYDYFYNQWGTFNGASAISSTIYQGKHTILNSSGIVSQETDGVYIDNGNPVLMSFKTGWLQLGGLQGYQRIHNLRILANYLSPHLMVFEIGYDFENVLQQIILAPSNYTGVYGSDVLYGQTSPFGGPGGVEQWKLDMQYEQCQAFQISLREVFDSSFGTSPGAGFTLSAITSLITVKSDHRPIDAANTVG